MVRVPYLYSTFPLYHALLRRNSTPYRSIRTHRVISLDVLRRARRNRSVFIKACYSVSFLAGSFAISKIRTQIQHGWFRTEEKTAAGTPNVASNTLIVAFSTFLLARSLFSQKEAPVDVGCPISAFDSRLNRYSWLGLRESPQSSWQSCRMTS